MILIKLIRWLYKTLNGDQSPAAIALAFAIGLFVGMLPFGLTMLAGLVALLVIKCHFGSGLIGFGLGATLAALGVADLIAHPIGMFILEVGPHSLFMGFATSDFMSLFRLHEAATVGVIGLAFLAAVPVFLGVRAFVRWFRGRYRDKLGKSKTFKTLGNIWLFRALRWVFVG